MFKILKSYTLPMDAYLLRVFLEGQGIEVFIYDDIIVTTNPLYSNAIGGVKVKVYQEDYDKAFQLLIEYERLQRCENEVELSCPKCGSTSVSFQINSLKDKFTWIAWLIAIALTVFPFYQKKVNRCMNCSNEF